MTCKEVVYWPRHLWTLDAASSSTVLCRRLSYDSNALCAVSLDAKASIGLELLPIKALKSRLIILFDAHVAALGNFTMHHSPQLLQQIGEQFVSFDKHNDDDKESADDYMDGTIGWLLETVGYYLIYVPFAPLLAVTTTIQHLVQDMKMPSWLLVGSGDSLAEISTFTAVLSYQLHNAASLPKRLRRFYLLRKQRGLSHRERLELLQVLDWICFVLLDMVLGQVALTYLGGIVTPIFHTTSISPIVVVKFLRDNVEWLMGAPAGFKLNKPLASIFGNGILLWLNLWSFIFDELVPLVSNESIGHWLLHICGHMGVTLQLTLVLDLLSLTTWHSHWIYLYFAKLNRLQFGLFSSLSKLFLGKKINVLRHRVDTCEYDVGQLLLGTLLFTILVFLVTTNLVFFVFFAGVRGSILLASLLLWVPVVALSSLPLASLLHRVWHPRLFVVGMQLQASQDSAADCIVIESVGVGHQSPQLETQHRLKLQRALVLWKTSKRCDSQNTIFELVPVASSVLAQFTRFRAYLTDVSARYSLAVIAKACLFGSAEIARVPLSIFFEYKATSCVPPSPWPLHVLLLLLLIKQYVCKTLPAQTDSIPSLNDLNDEDYTRLRNCPCPSSSDELSSSSLCLPVDFTGKKYRKEVFAFSVTTTDRWKLYDWEKLTTVAWNEDKQLLCHAHSKGVKVVVKHNFDDVDQLCNSTTRQAWIKATYSKIVENYADGVNIDTEKPMHGATSHCLGLLVQELRSELERHVLTKNAQITFDVPWAPRGVDGRYYPWHELSIAADFLFVMSYDMRSQVYDACIAGANSPLALVKQGLQEFLLAYDVIPDKLVLGVPWYGYLYRCLDQATGATDDTSWCQIQPVPFFGAPCSDAAGRQVDYGDIQQMVKSNGLVEQWDPLTQTPFVWFSPEGQRSQIWFDNPRSLTAKYALVRELGLRGVGMWNADTLDYFSVNASQLMWASLEEAFTEQQYSY
ncbi:unnamed protein product [Peronospora belbahrii]|uniref:GH18 domain-containing protein n=1 Tax=Peronospora belbahrii TaxID=622444 RepID=A0AAU9L236_9STRA|nr:unnamed protein product [Peronospora belbahrii]